MNEKGGESTEEEVTSAGRDVSGLRRDTVKITAARMDG